MTPQVKGFFDQNTCTISYVIWDEGKRECAIIDPVLDYDIASGRTATDSADLLVNFIKQQSLTVIWILETHIHADHLSSAPYLKGLLGGKVSIGCQVTQVQAIFGDIFDAGETFSTDGRQFDHLFQDGESFQIGDIECRVLLTPGHTPACATYICGNAVFVGDTLFMPDYGTARCDFPGGDAAELYHSIQKILALPAETRLFMCHDYAPNGRPIAWETTVTEQKSANIHIADSVSEADFVSTREGRDKGLSMPKLIIPSVQINMRAGHPPEPADNGKVYLKVPFNTL